MQFVKGLDNVTLSAVLWALGVWVAMTAAALGIAAAVVVSLPPDFFRDAAPRAAGTWGWGTLRRVARDAVGVLLILVGLVLSIPGVPGQGVITILAGVLLVDFPGRHRVACALARVPGVLATMNGIRRWLHRPPLLPPP